MESTSAIPPPSPQHLQLTTNTQNDEAFNSFFTTLTEFFGKIKNVTDDFRARDWLWKVAHPWHPQENLAQRVNLAAIFKTDYSQQETLTQRQVREVTEIVSRSLADLEYLTRLLESPQYANTQLPKQLESLKFGLQDKFGATNNIAIICDFASLIRELDSSKLDKLLRWDNAKCRLALQPLKSIWGLNQSSANYPFKELKIFDKQHELDSLPISKLAQLLIVCEILMATYALHYTKEPNGMLDIWNSLREVQKATYKAISNQVGEDEPQDLVKQFKEYLQLAKTLRDSLEQSPIYPSGFFREELHRDILMLHESLWPIYKKAILYPQKKKLEIQDGSLSWRGRKKSLQPLRPY